MYLLHVDLEIKNFIEKKLSSASISKIVIERAAKKLRLTIFSSKPGIIIGKKGADIEKLKKELIKLTGSEINLNIIETKKPELDA